MTTQSLKPEARDFRGGPAGTLTDVLWAEAILPAGFVFFFFWLRPRADAH